MTGELGKAYQSIVLFYNTEYVSSALLRYMKYVKDCLDAFIGLIFMVTIIVLLQYFLGHSNARLGIFDHTTS